MLPNFVSIIAPGAFPLAVCAWPQGVPAARSTTPAITSQTNVLPTLICAPSSLASQGKDARETFDALFNGVQQRIAIRQPDTVASRAPRRGKTEAGVIVHLRGPGFFKKCLCINVLR